MKIQSAIRIIYPPQCLICGLDTTEEFALCGSCWREAPFITGLVCDGCGTPLPGQDADETALCDSCLIAPHVWNRARAVFVYQGSARRMVLSLKHGDRQDLIRPMRRWLMPLVQKLADPTAILVPVPLHRTRLFMRRYNQSALLARSLASVCGLDQSADALKRHRATRPQEGMTRQQRQENQANAFLVPANRVSRIQGRTVVLVDDVLTSGATLDACASACFSAGAKTVNAVVLARVARNT